jgi:hypothetical protein
MVSLHFNAEDAEVFAKVAEKTGAFLCENLCVLCVKNLP